MGPRARKWLLGSNGQWYFIKRNGALYRWKGQNNIVQGVQRMFERQVNGRNTADGDYVDAFGEPPNDEKGIENEFYADPQKLCARPFKSITTGPDIFEKMAGENGTRRIGLFDDEDATTFETKVKAHQLLTGTMFGPTPSDDFGWTFESLLKHVENPQLGELKSSDIYRDRFEKFIEDELEQNFDKSFQKILSSDPETRLALWYRLWYALDLEAPARQTCLIVTINKPVARNWTVLLGVHYWVKHVVEFWN